MCVRVWSWVDRPAWAASSWLADVLAVSSRPSATTSSPISTDPPSTRTLRPSPTRREEVAPARGLSLVDHRDAGVDEDLGAAVGEPAGDHLRTVDHRHHAGLDERLGRRAVEVDLVEHGDVAGRRRGEEGGVRRSVRAVPVTPVASVWRRVLSFTTRVIVSAGAGTDPAGRGARARRPGGGQDVGSSGRDSRSSRAWARAVSDSSIPANIRDSSRSRPAASSTVSPEVVTEPSLAFSTTTWRSAYAATCGRWVTTSTWAEAARAASRRPTSTAALPPTPAVDLVEDEGRHRAGAREGDLEGKHHPRELTARCALRQRSGLGTGVGRQQELHLVDARRAEAHPGARADPEPVVGRGLPDHHLEHAHAAWRAGRARR